MLEAQTPEVIVTCMKKRMSGVTTTIINLLPVQATQMPLAYVGSEIPSLLETRAASRDFQHLSFWQAVSLSMKKRSDGKRLIWHIRRDHEQVLLLFLKWLLRLPIALVFTSAATRQHGKFTLWLIKKMDAVIATTPLAAQMIQSAEPKNLAVIPHGVNTARFCPPADKGMAWQSSGLSGKYGIGIFGRVRHQKGIHLYVEALIELLPKHPDFTAVICGECKTEDMAYKADLVKRIETAGLSNRIVFLGLVSNEELLRWYQQVSITVACPLNEGFGLTPLEGMACESAIVASRTGAFEELVIEGKTGHLIPTDDAPALITALADLMGDIDKMKMYAQAGRKRVLEHYSIQAEARAIGRVYESLQLTTS